MILVNEGVSQAKYMVLVIWVTVIVQLSSSSGVCESRSKARAYQFQNSNFHHTLVEISWFVFDNFNGNDLVRLHVLTFYHLAKCALT